MQHFFYPGYTSKRILCAHCDLYFTEMHFENRLVCRGVRPFNYCKDYSAIRARTKIHPEQWKIFIDAYPQFASEAESESYHGGSYRRDPDMLKNFIPKVLVIPESIVPNYQCYKEYNHKAKERSNTRVEPEKNWYAPYELYAAMSKPATAHEVEFHERIMPYRTQGGLVTGHNY